MLPERKIFSASARGLDNRIVYKNRKVFAKYQLKRKSYYHTNLHQISKSLLQLFIFLLWLKMAGLSLLVVASLLDICNKTNLMLDIFKVHEKLLDYLQSSSTLPCKTRPDQTRLDWNRPDKTRLGQMRWNKTRPDWIGPVQTGLDQTGQDQTRPYWTGLE